MIFNQILGGGGGNLGGLANMVDTSTSDYALQYMLAAIKNGNTVGGTVTYSQAFTNTEQLILQTGLQTIHGFMFVALDTDMITNIATGHSNKWVLVNMYVAANDKYSIVGYTQANAFNVAKGRVFGTAYAAPPENGTIRISGGDIYYTARYDKNANYQIVRPNLEYEWLAW